MLLKRKNDEHVKSQQKLRHVMSLLKRSSTPSKIRKLNACYVPSPSKKLSRVHINKSHRAADAPLHKGRTYSRSFLTERSVPDANIFKVDSRARLKYDLLQKEIANCIATKQSLNVVKCLLSQSKRLLGEQHELLAERSRIVTADYENTGVYDPETPQYMDERLGYLEYELSAIDSKIRVVQEHLVRSGAITDAFAFEGALELNQDPFFEVDGVDVTWENCINLLLSLNRKELDDVSVMILEDFVSVRIEADDGKAVLEERTKSIADLKVLIDQYKTAELDKELSINALEGEQVAESLETAQPSAEASKALSPKRTRSTRVSEEFGDHLNTNPLLFPTRSSPMSHESRSFSAASLKTLSGSTGPSTNDVFERLASAHTLASQAKVIPKLTMFVEKTLPDVTS